MSNIALLQEYIKALIVNVNKTYVQRDINVIFDGGAFNGAFAAGIGLYLKCMEDHKLIKVHSISGCSIGSILSVWYLTGCRQEGIQCFEQFMNSYKKNMNLYDYKSIVIKCINHIISSTNNITEQDIINKLNGRLFITYYNVKIHKQKTVSKFKDKAHIIDCILRSSHIPYLMDGLPSYKKKYMDGVSPYTPKNGLPNLFIKLLTLKKCARSLMLKSENNIHYRLLTGITDINEFFITGSSDMCSYVHNWSYSDIVQLRVREILMFLIFSLIGLMVAFKKFVPLVLTNSLLYNGIGKALNGLYIDFVGKVLV
jgi:hypothetical protein